MADLTQDSRIAQFIRDTARQLGIDPDIAIQVAESEGGITEPARLGDFSGAPWYSGKSWWPFQLHYGGQGYSEFGNTAGMGNSFTQETGWAPGDPNAWEASVIYALNHAAQYGWGAWYGAKARGITGFQGITRGAQLLPVPKAGSVTPWIPPPDPSSVHPPPPDPPNIHPPAPIPATAGGLGNLITLPDWNIGSFFGQPITVNATGLANVGGRFIVSAIALALIAVGILALAWNAAPSEGKTAVKHAAVAAVA